MWSYGCALSTAKELGSFGYAQRLSVGNGLFMSWDRCRVLAHLLNGYFNVGECNEKKWDLPVTVRRAYAIISAATLPVALSTSFEIIAAVRMCVGAFAALRRCK